MWNRKQGQVPYSAPPQPVGVDTQTELSSAWKSLSQTKAALRHIENRLEAAPGTAVVLDSVMEPKKASGSSTRKVSRRDRRVSDPSLSGPGSKPGTRTAQSPEKTSRSPLRATTLDNNIRRPNCVEFREPLASYREPTPPLLTPSQLESWTVQSERPLPPHHDAQLSQLVYLRDTRDQQTRDPESTISSAPDSTVVRYLNDRSALDVLRQPERAGILGGPRPEGVESGGGTCAGEGSSEALQSSSPGSASRRLENLRRKQPDDKLEKLKERIRRQREHLDEGAEPEGVPGHLERPVGVASSNEDTTAARAAKVRKVAAAPPAPVYKGFNSSETKIRTRDGKVWREEDLQKLSVEMYRELAMQSSVLENAAKKPKLTDGVKEKKPSKPVRKIHKSASVPSADSRPVAPAISTASWREGQKLVKMVLGPTPRIPHELQAESAHDTAKKGSPARAKSEPRPESNRQQRASSIERTRNRAPSEAQTKSSRPAAGSAGDRAPASDFLRADIRGILDDLQLDGTKQEPAESKPEIRGPTRPKGRARSAPGAPSHGSRSASPGKRGPPAAEVAVPKHRHYDADTVRRYIARQQEERRKRQQEERRAQKEEAEQRSRRLQELYRRQREGVTRPPPGPEGPAQKRLQETYTKLLQDQAKLEGELPWTLPVANSVQPKPLYQPSGESDKENKQLDRPQSASSSSDLSLSEPQPPPLTRDDLGVRMAWLQQGNTSSSLRAGSSLAPPSGQLLTQLLGLEPGMSGMKRPEQRVPSTDGLAKSKLSRIEALKATAASLSTRIETEARRLARAGPGDASTLESGPVDTGRREQSEGSVVKPVSPPERDGAELDHLAPMIQRLLSAGRAIHDSALPGVGNVHSFLNVTEKVAESARPQPSSDSPALGSARHLDGLRDAHVLASSLERGRRVERRSSSGSSISEGLLISEGSLSEGDGSPSPGPAGCIRPAERLATREFCAAQLDAVDPISRFKREAQKYPAYSPEPAGTEGRGPWEELAKGSPHSVISIFTKHLHGHSKAVEDRMERPSSPLRPAVLTASPVNMGGYEDDFVSASCSGGSRAYSGLSSISSMHSTHDNLQNRKPPCSAPTLTLQSHHSSGSTPVSSPRSGASARRRAPEENVLEVESADWHNRSSSDLLENRSQESRQGSHGRSPSYSLGHSVDSNGTLHGASGQSPVSPASDVAASCRSPGPSPSPSGSPRGAAVRRSPPGTATLPDVESRRASKPPAAASLPSARAIVEPSASVRHSAAGNTEPKAAGELHYAPGALQQRMSAELSYLDAIEESVRQLTDVERLRGVSLAQQDSVSLAQILKAQQQKHEHELLLLKLKTEKEELETKRQLEETRQRAARACTELQENMEKSQQHSLGGLQETTSRMMEHQADTARHIKELTELARSHIADALSVSPGPGAALFCQQREHSQALAKHLQPRPASDSRRSESSPVSTRAEESPSSLNSTFESTPTRTPVHSISSVQVTPSLCSSNTPVGRERSGSSVEEEVHTAADDSLRTPSSPLAPDDKDNTSIATEYSLRLDESMTEEDVEERSFRSLLPSEAHRRVTMEKKQSGVDESEEEAAGHERASTGTAKSHDSSMPFSSGQDSFSRFTMEMVRQYMTEEEVRAQHQSSLLRLREKALKEKTRAELAWLEHQKRRLRDKGEDDKMPPIRKKQRGLLLKLQQEQAEIKRLQEANKAARKERQLLLKQQEEIERMRHSTLRLKERLKCSGETSADAPVLEPADEVTTPSVSVTDLDTRSPSPVSVSGSETSSIMQKLKKMRCHMDEKFLTKREQQLVNRRRHAEELLQWKQRLDAEEAEVRRMEEQAMAAWARARRPREGPAGAATGGPKEEAPGAELETEDSRSPSVQVSKQPTESSVPEELGSPSTHHPVSELSSLHKDLSQEENSVYSEDFDPESKQSPSVKSGGSTSRQPESNRGDRANGQKAPQRPASWTEEPVSSEHHSASQSGTTSDQSDIESRVCALKEELRRRKLIVYQLKKEQRRRHKERLKAQEASLLKQLESYNDFIQKTQAELGKQLDATAKPQIKTPTSATEKPRIKAPPIQRPETIKNWKIVTESEKRKKGHSGSPTELEEFTPSSQEKVASVPEEASLDGVPIVTPTPVLGSPDHSDGSRTPISVDLEPGYTANHASIQSEGAKPLAMDSGDESIINSQQSEVEEELENLRSDQSENDSFHSLKLDQDIQQQDSVKDNLSRFHRGDQEGLWTQTMSVREEMTEGFVQEGEMRFGVLHSIKSVSAAEDTKCKDQQLTAISPYIKDSSYSPDFDLSSSEKENVGTASEVCANSYHDDFEQSVEASPQDHCPSSKQSSPEVLEKEQTSYNSEEDIIEDLSAKLSSTSNGAHSEKLLDVKVQPEDFNKRTVEDKDVSSPWQSHSVSHPQSSSSILDVMPDFKVGDRVLVSNVEPGTLRFKGLTSFANGFWAGVELDKPEGSNNGTYDGVAYFECEDGHGIFAPPEKISPLPEKFEVCVDTTEDDDSFFDDPPESESKKKHGVTHGQSKLRAVQDKKEESESQSHSKSTAPSDIHKTLPEYPDNQTLDEDLILHPSVTLELSDLRTTSKKLNGNQHPIPNGTSRNIILEFQDVSASDRGLLITDVEKETTEREEVEKASSPLQILSEKDSVEGQQKNLLSDLIAEEQQDEKSDAEKRFDEQHFSTFADKLLDGFLRDAIKQFQQIKKEKNDKIFSANQLTRNKESTALLESLPSYIEGHDDVSSPDLCARPDSPVLGVSGQEELAKRLAELELSREVLDDLGDDQDWFDEDFGLSSRKEQQKRQQQQEPVALGPVTFEGGHEAKTLAKVELVQKTKVPEEPAMVVPHTAPEVEQLVHTATQVIWSSCGLGHGLQCLSNVPTPRAPDEYLGGNAQGQDLESLSKRSYRQTIFDLTWEIIQEIFAEDPNTHQPQWAKPRRMNSLYFRRVKCPSDINEVQAFVTSEVLKLLGLKKDQNQKTDWQKMLKFGRKKRDRVDHILVQELHEEECQWVNYDEDELFVKMQLADSIFDSLMKDTVDVFVQIQEKRVKRS